MENSTNFKEKIWSKTSSLNEGKRSLLNDITLGHLPYPQALFIPNFKPVCPIAKSQSDNYTHLNQKILSKTCSLKQEIRSLLHNSTLGHLSCQQALSMPNFRSLSLIAQLQSDNYTNLNPKIRSKTCSLKQEIRSLLHHGTLGHLPYNCRL